MTPRERRGPTVRLVRRVGAAEEGRALSSLLREWAAERTGDEVAPSRVRALIVSGAVRVDGAVLRSPSRPLRRAQRVDAVLRVAELRSPSRATDRPFELTESRILYQDDWLLAVDKPPGLLTHPSADPARSSLVSHVRLYLRSRGRSAYVAVHQRLDRDTSGVVLFAVDDAANAGLARAFEGHEVEKRYVALSAAEGAYDPGSILVRAPLLPRKGGGVSVDPERGLVAETRVRIVERLARVALVEAWPLGGRRHQVRAHLAHAGLPVLGDELYGGPSRVGDVVAPRTLLHAARLALPHPLSGRPLVIESALPDDLLAALRAARAGAGR